MIDVKVFVSVILCCVTLISIYILRRKPTDSSKSMNPPSYPLIGSYPALIANKDRRIQWTSQILQNSPSSTFVLERSLGLKNVFTANPSNVQHILKSHFNNYQKGDFFRETVRDFLGDGIFNADGDTWKFQRQVASHEFNTKSLRKFLEQVVDSELHDRLIPTLLDAAKNQTVIDFQDVLQRFAFDNICKIAFGHDPEYLSPSLPEKKFARAFEEATQLISGRFNPIFPFIWRFKRALNLGSERRLRKAVTLVLDFAREVVRDKKEELERNSRIDSVDLLSRFLSSGHTDEKFVVDIVVSFILAGRDTTSAALTWFFWLTHKNKGKEVEILKEIGEKRSESYEEVKELAYTHACLCESMRLYPPVPVDSKEAISDDVLPTGTVVKKGMRVSYHPYAMGRLEEIWGEDWAEYRPERWLERDCDDDGWKFVARDPYVYTVFQAGPRICLGKEMAFLQMKSVVAGVLRRFHVVPADEGSEPVFESFFTAKMRGGFPVKIVERIGFINDL